MRRWWTLIDLCRFFIRRFGLRLKFQDHFDSVDRFVIDCFGLKENLRHVDTLKGAVGTWIVPVLADDPYTYLNAKNIHSAGFIFFAIWFCAPTWVRLIVRDIGCLGLFSFITTFGTELLDYAFVVYWFRSLY